MRKLGIALLLSLGLVTVSLGETGIEADALLGHIKFLASDDLRGRANGSEGLERAGDYVAQQFKAAGLAPGEGAEGWFQPFELIAGLTVGRGNSLSFEFQGKKATFVLGTSYYPLTAPGDNSPSAQLQHVPLVFAGYGIAVRDVGYDDYAGIDVNGKAVLIFSHEPQEHDTNSRLNGVRPMPQTSLVAKATLARSKGARALFVVSDPSHRADEGQYSVFNGDPDAEDVGFPFPVVRVRRTELQPLLDAWKLEAIARQIDTDLVPRSEVLRGATVDYVEQLSKNRRTVRNVIGVLTGSDPARAKEAIVIGAHYDHVGLGGHLSMSPERTGEIHNGADDNASGTASIIEIARVAHQERARFPRTLVFVAFAGEERGLLGSAYYAEHPVVPIANTVAMLNLDMVGRARGAVDISGLEVSPSMEADLKAAVQALGEGLTIERQGPGAGRSDDYNFSAHRIPAINFFTGFHADYHRPTDDWDKIDAIGTRRVATLALELAAHIAERPSRPEFVQK
ncbi:MAG TPA: M20/M25/M40 family metallo-hydrolase [Vicinamibacterales bacterium]|nr:M20/M25/M40 family metallo-hydrolase [Vicinamibacterales bacterium]